jgi:hypothetical protein
MKRSCQGFICAIVLAFGWSTVPSAVAQVVDAACVGVLEAQFAPPLGLLPKPVTLTAEGDLTCVFAADGSTHTAALRDLVGSGNLSCLISTQLTGSARIDWDDGETSAFDWHSVEVGLIGLPSVPRVFVLQGEVTSGRFAGDTLIISYNDLPDLNNFLKCLTDAFDQITGLPTFTFTRPLPE